MWKTAVFLTALSVATIAQAGAWLREEGRAFISLSNTFRDTADYGLDEIGLYGEYGYAPKLTLGVDINQRPAQASHALVFARFPLLPETGPHRLAAEFGAGVHGGSDNWQPMGKVTLSYGRGFPLGEEYGWLAIDAAYEYRSGLGHPVYKLDATAGQSTGGRIRPILQLESTHIPGTDTLWAATPGIIIDGWTDNQTWLIGIERRYALRYSTGLKLALWHRF